MMEFWHLLLAANIVTSSAPTPWKKKKKAVYNGLVVKNPPANAGDIADLRKSLGKGNG